MIDIVAPGLYRRARCETKEMTVQRAKQVLVAFTLGVFAAHTLSRRLCGLIPKYHEIPKDIMMRQENVWP